MLTKREARLYGPNAKKNLNLGDFLAADFPDAVEAYVRESVKTAKDRNIKVTPVLMSAAHSTALSKELVEALIHDLQQIYVRLDELAVNRGADLADSYKGTWRRNIPYQRGALVTYRSSLWLCEADTDAQPGNGPDWKMVSKSGEPPKDNT